ncbi:uncharacterized protein LOC131243454 isoform X2 [Magnolia sinica]|uniref:uncharacterized protein LOC131243454 isoform X2 n=1 Tax=Magnolia sinica TaxID=86752 RepID=UPI00265A6C44|nr:uncharacterized protein LOC131243454 isoform X2 [Magnolia sinica]
MGEGREGDWECGGCHNRNYAFRSFCNRCKQPRLLVDTTSPADSKWLPRIGDWICTGCSNNNYASREKCKKCGEPKEVAAMPAIAMPGASLPTYAHYFARAHGGPGFKMNFGITGNSALQQSLPSNANWLFGGANKYGLPSASVWPLGGNNGSGFPYANNASQLLVVPKGWRNGDWMCHCGFHNYSSRAQCKKCNASLPSAAPSSMANSAASDLFPLSPSLNFGRSPHGTLQDASKHGTHASYPALGTKRLASDEFVNEWDNKRLNAGDIYNHALTNGQQRSYQGFEQMVGSSNDQTPGMYVSHPSASSAMAANFQMHVQSPQLAAMPTLLGKGCKTQKDALTKPVSVA